MKKIKKVIVLMSLLLLTGMAMSQISIPQSRVQFGFPNGGWKFLKNEQLDKNTTMYLYSYCDKAVVNSAGDTILPFMRIYVKKNFYGSVYEFAYKRYQHQPFETLDETTRGLPGDQGICYWGAYTSPQDNQDYAFRMMYFKDKTMIFEVRLETTADTYKQFDEEFRSILQTFTVKK